MNTHILLSLVTCKEYKEENNFARYNTSVIYSPLICIYVLQCSHAVTAAALYNAAQY